ncbi:hypothetical protein [Rhizobium tubonense]|nr:hypothetical protein [Rhizobium tubonense]
MHDLSFNCYEDDAEVIIAALSEWCRSTSSEPDALLMSRAIFLFNRGNDSVVRLVDALRTDLLH